MAENDFKNEEDFKKQCGYQIDDQWYPRVTRIVEMKAKPALYVFYGTVGYREGKAISAKSAEEGTAVHEAAERILIGGRPGIVPATIAPAIRGLLAFLKENKISVVPEHVERRIINKEHRYAGTIDTLATINGKFGVLDIKTSESIYRDYNIQTSAYMDALRHEFPQLETRWILRIDQAQKCYECNATRRNKGGREKIKRNRKEACRTYEHAWAEPEGIVELKELTDPWQEDFKAFLGAKELWEWEHRDWLKRIQY